jgi:hypothetical protein
MMTFDWVKHWTLSFSLRLQKPTTAADYRGQSIFNEITKYQYVF